MPVVSKRLKRVNTAAKANSGKKTSARRRQCEAQKRMLSHRSARDSEAATSDAESSLGNLSEREALRLCRDTEDFDDILSLLSHGCPKVRVAALEQVCPCRLRGHDDDDIWTKVFTMVHDDNLGVKKQVTLTAISLSELVTLMLDTFGQPL